MGLTLRPKLHSGIELRPLVQGILDEIPTCTMSTVNQDGTAHINTALFCIDSEWRLFFTSSNDAKHSKNIVAQPSLAVAVFNSDQNWDDWKTGLQLFGTCTVPRDRDAHLADGLYRKRFPAYERWLHDLGQSVEHSNLNMFFMFVPRSVKLLHEEVLGDETFVSISLTSRIKSALCANFVTTFTNTTKRPQMWTR